MKNILKEAHKLTREIKNKYQAVDYKFQLVLCIKFLYEKGDNEMVELKGTEKQVNWANDIRDKKISELDEFIIALEEVVTHRSEKKLSRGKEVSEKNLRSYSKRFIEMENFEEGILVEEAKELREKLIKEESSAVFYIDNRTKYAIELLRRFSIK